MGRPCGVTAREFAKARGGGLPDPMRLTGMPVELRAHPATSRTNRQFLAYALGPLDRVYLPRPMSQLLPDRPSRSRSSSKMTTGAPSDPTRSSPWTASRSTSPSRGSVLPWTPTRGDPSTDGTARSSPPTPRYGRSCVQNPRPAGPAHHRRALASGLSVRRPRDRARDDGARGLRAGGPDVDRGVLDRPCGEGMFLARAPRGRGP